MCSLIKKILNAAYFLIYLRTTRKGASEEILIINWLARFMGLGKEYCNILYLIDNRCIWIDSETNFSLQL
jgi:hypothetical protein